jgi:hypothetical protein
MVKSELTGWTKPKVLAPLDSSPDRSVDASVARLIESGLSRHRRRRVRGRATALFQRGVTKMKLADG